MTQNPVFFLACGAVAPARAGRGVVGGLGGRAPPLPALRPVAGPVTRVVDGDTFWIGKDKIRLWGIDAPEASTPNGPVATRYLVAVVANHRLTCHQAGPPSRDRMVARCLDPWGRDIAEIMAGAGWALDWPAFSGGHYRLAQERAAALRAGAHAQDAPLWR